jgi:hypothetical protein
LSPIREMKSKSFVLASTACATLGGKCLTMSMGVKSDKTFEEIVERLAALFKLKARPGDRDYEESIEIDPGGAPSTPPEPPTPVAGPSKNKR